MAADAPIAFNPARGQFDSGPPALRAGLRRDLTPPRGRFKFVQPRAAPRRAWDPAHGRRAGGSGAPLRRGPPPARAVREVITRGLVSRSLRAAPRPRRAHAAPCPRPRRALPAARPAPCGLAPLAPVVRVYMSRDQPRAHKLTFHSRHPSPAPGRLRHTRPGSLRPYNMVLFQCRRQGPMELCR